MALEGVDRLDAVAGLGDDVQVRLLVDDVRDAGPQQRVIVDEQHARPGDRRRRRAFSVEHRTCVGIENDGGSQASTTSVPLRGAVTMVSDAPMRSARSCMLVMPKPASRRSRAMPRPSSATDSRKPIERTGDAWIVMRRAREWRTALVSASCAMPMISRSTPSPKRRQLVDVEVDRHVGRPLREVGHALERRARRPRRRRRCGRSARDRSPRLDHVRAREIDRGLEALARPPAAATRAVALRRLQLHQDRGESLRQVVVNVARQPVAFFEDRLAPLLDAALLGQAAVVQRQRRLPRDRLEQRSTPRALAVGGGPVDERHPAEVASRQQERRDDQRRDTRLPD